MKKMLVFTLIMVAIMLTGSTLPAIAEGQGKGNDGGKGNQNQGQSACENASDKSKATQKNPHCSSGGEADLVPFSSYGYSILPDNTLGSVTLGAFAINLGPATAVNTIIQVTNLSPDVATFIPPANCIGDGLALTCTVGNVSPSTGLPANIELNLIQNSLPFEFQYHIAVSSDTSDPNPSNNEEDSNIFIAA